LTDIYVDGDACPVREEIYRVAARLKVKVFVVSNGSRPIRPPGMSNVSMILVGDSSDAADDWIAGDRKPVHLGSAQPGYRSSLRVYGHFRPAWGEAALRRYLAGKITVLLGQEDVGSRNLATSEEAEEQGSTRF
jgi:hypothetical protein